MFAEAGYNDGRRGAPMGYDPDALPHMLRRYRQLLRAYFENYRVGRAEFDKEQAEKRAALRGGTQQLSFAKAEVRVLDAMTGRWPAGALNG